MCPDTTLTFPLWFDKNTELHLPHTCKVFIYNKSNTWCYHLLLLFKSHSMNMFLEINFKKVMFFIILYFHVTKRNFLCSPSFVQLNVENGQSSLFESVVDRAESLSTEWTWHSRNIPLFLPHVPHMKQWQVKISKDKTFAPIKCLRNRVKVPQRSTSRPRRLTWIWSSEALGHVTLLNYTFTSLFFRTAVKLKAVLVLVQSWFWTWFWTWFRPGSDLI